MQIKRGFRIMTMVGLSWAGVLLTGCPGDAPLPVGANDGGPTQPTGTGGSNGNATGDGCNGSGPKRSPCGVVPNTGGAGGSAQQPATPPGGSGGTSGAGGTNGAAPSNPGDATDARPPGTDASCAGPCIQRGDTAPPPPTPPADASADAVSCGSATDDRRNDGCTPARIETQATTSIGGCKCVLGWYWNGADCVASNGCSCVSGCERLYKSAEACRADHASCPMTPMPTNPPQPTTPPQQPPGGPDQPQEPPR